MEIKTLIILLVTGVLFFLVIANIIVPFFAATYEYGGLGTEPCNKNNACQGITAASLNIRNPYCLTNGTVNTSITGVMNNTGYERFLSTCFTLMTGGNTNDVNGCWSCGSWSGIKTATQGLMLFVFFMIVVAVIIIIAIKFMPKFA
jgi:hypothetical protein